MKRTVVATEPKDKNGSSWSLSSALKRFVGKAPTEAAAKNVDSTVLEKPNSRQAVDMPTKSTSSSQVPESLWHIGGRYAVNGLLVVFGSNSLDDADILGTMQSGDRLLLLAFEEDTERRGTKRGYVISPSAGDPLVGWVCLEAPGQPSVVPRRRLQGSWEFKARYRVKHPATLRATPSLTSPWVAEVSPQQEVIVLDMQVTEAVAGKSDVSGTKSRLRALVSTAEDEVVGWLSPETLTGECLLDPINLLGPEVVTVHRRSVSDGKARSSIAESMNKGGNPQGGMHMLVPWKVGGKYRVLEPLEVFSGSDIGTSKVGIINPAAVVEVMEVHISDNEAGWCPMLNLCVAEAPTDAERQLRGWARAAAEDGRDFIDSRDQMQVDAVLKKVAKKAAEPKPAPWQLQASVAHMKAELEREARGEASSDSEEDSSSEEDSRDVPSQPSPMKAPEVRVIPPEQPRARQGTADAENESEEEYSDATVDVDSRRDDDDDEERPQAAYDFIEEAERYAAQRAAQRAAAKAALDKANSVEDSVPQPEDHPPPAEDFVKAPAPSSRNLQDLEEGNDKEETIVVVDDVTFQAGDSSACENCTCGATPSRFRQQVKEAEAVDND